jgi:hypothetical protein
MKDPIRLREGGSSFEASLLDSAHDEKAGEHVRSALHATLGLATAAAIATTTTSAAAAGAATGAAAAKGGAGTALGLAIAKWTLVVVVAGVVAGKTAEYVRTPHAAPVANTVVSSTATPPGRAAPPSAHAESAPVVQAIPDDTLERRVSTPPAQATEARVIAPGLSSAPSPTPASSSLLAELSPIDAARAALDSENPALALEQLNRHDLDFPHGQLGPEALALRIEVYASWHDDSKVRELTQRFLTQYPDHPQAARIKSMAARR